jgi:hypothetical protein
MSSARSVREAVALPRHSLAATGNPIGLARNGRRTTTARTTQVLPKPILSLPRPDPSCAHNAPKTFFPTRWTRVSSMTSRTGASWGSSPSTTARANRGPNWLRSHEASEKNACARRCGHTRASPAPVSMPVTVRRPVCATIPAARWQKVSNECFEKHGRVT